MRISDWSSDVCSSDLVDTINCGDVLDRKKAWASRWEWLEKMPTFASLSAVDAARLSDGVSLALLQPKRLLGLDISKARNPDWTDEEREKLLQEQIDRKSTRLNSSH